MRRVLVATALEIEARALARHLRLQPLARHDVVCYRGPDLEVACLGYRAARLPELADELDADLVIVAGACGALAPSLSTGALVAPEAVVTMDGASYPTDALPGLARSGQLLTTTEVVGTAEAKARLWLQTGADAVDMESAPVLAWARARGMRAVVVRGVADVASAAVPAELAATVEADGRVRTARALRAVLARPAVLSQAMALRSSTTTALATVAAALARILAAR